jgi:hypothetical protein
LKEPREVARAHCHPVGEIFDSVVSGRMSNDPGLQLANIIVPVGNQIRT